MPVFRIPIRATVTLIVLLLPLGVAGHLGAAPQTWTGVATHDGMYAAVVNPAALAFGNAAGIGVEIPIDYPPESLGLFLNSPGGAYVLEYGPDGARHRVASAGALGRALAFGSSWLWDGSAFRDGTLQLGVLSRVTRSLAVGAHVRDAFGPAADLTVGVGIRPLGFHGSLGSRATIGADAVWDFDRSFAISHVHLNVEPVDGVRISGGFAPETRNVSFALSMNTRHFELGGRSPGRDERIGSGYAFFSARSRRSIFSRLTPSIVEYDRAESIVSAPTVRLFTSGVPLSSVLSDIGRLRDDPSVEAVVLQNQHVPGNLAEMIELRDALAEFRAAGKAVYYYFDSISHLNYMLAAATGDAIVLHPLGSVDVRGFSYAGVYFGDLLSSLGIRFYNFASHDFKTANNRVAESEMTDAERTMWRSLLSDLHDTYTASVTAGRGPALNDDPRESIAAGPYLVAEKAKRLGFVDELAYPEDIWEFVAERHPRARRTGFARTSEMTYDWAAPARSRVAVIYAVGNIVTGDGVSGRMIGSDSLTAAIRDAHADPFVHGIILRVESGGGSAIASDTIAREIAKTVAEGTPVVVSMGGVAASGGYYISAPASHILASPGTITGSIGVITGIVTVDDLLERLAIGTETIKTTPSADLGSPLRTPRSDEERALRQYIDATYQRFLAVVSEHRGMAVDDVDAVAQGRIWTGAQALDLGLVDSLGGLSESFSVMRTLLHAELLDIVEVVPGPRPSSLVQDLALRAVGSAGILLDSAETREMLDLYALFRQHSGEALYLMPYRIK
ncbi:MAG: signal peptide peptidase SppA [Spirochaetaceae bacterium]|nr:MAG: signal peptide peptidase SppA [Spirochaetaceae bacterium]